MVGEKLHDYDLYLCDYVCGNIRQYLGQKAFAKALKEQAHPPVLLQYLLDGVNPDIDQEWLLLNDTELEGLMETFESIELAREWVPSEPLHERYVETVREVRDELSKQVAEDWSRACDRFASRLEEPRLHLSEGIEIVQEWLWKLRRLLQSMGATNFLPCPKGKSPTPTCLMPPGTHPPVPSKTPAETAIERMRKVIQGREDGKHATAKSLIKAAKIGNKRGRDALRWLQDHGEYEGLQRDRPDRFKQRRPNER